MKLSRSLCLGIALGAWNALWIVGFLVSIQRGWIFSADVPADVRSFWWAQLQDFFVSAGVRPHPGAWVAGFLGIGAALGVIFAFSSRALEPNEQRSSNALRWSLAALIRGGRPVIAVSMALIIAPLLLHIIAPLLLPGYAENIMAMVMIVAMLLLLVAPFILLHPERLKGRPKDFRLAFSWPGVRAVAGGICLFAVVTIVDELLVRTLAEPFMFLTSAVTGIAMWVLLGFLFVRRPRDVAELSHLVSGAEARSAVVLLMRFAAAVLLLVGPGTVTAYWSWKIVPGAAAVTSGSGGELSAPALWLLALVSSLGDWGWPALTLPFWALFLLSVGRLAQGAENESLPDDGLRGDAARVLPGFPAPY